MFYHRASRAVAAAMPQRIKIKATAKKRKITVNENMKMTVKEKKRNPRKHIIPKSIQTTSLFSITNFQCDYLLQEGTQRTEFRKGLVKEIERRWSGGGA